MKRIATVAAVLVSILSAGQQGLEQELKTRSENEGLALVQAQSNWLNLLQFGDHLELTAQPGDHPISDGYMTSMRNPRDFSTAWFSSDGKVVAWNIYRIMSEQFKPCPYPVIVEMLDSGKSWQLPGNLINVPAISVSPDGNGLAFDGTFRPAATGAAQTTGLHYFESKTNTIRLILPLSEGHSRVNSISFAPDGSRFAYGYQNRIYIYDVVSATSRIVAPGDHVTWSPNGRWITFRSMKGQAETLNASTFQPVELIRHWRILDRVVWSPDSRYVAVTEEVGMIENLLHWRNPIFGPEQKMIVERIEDHASAIVYLSPFEGFSVSGFYWVADYRSFMQAASRFPVVEACGH
jgi:WD40 repeat protein